MIDWYTPRLTKWVSAASGSYPLAVWLPAESRVLAQLVVILSTTFNSRQQGAPIQPRRTVLSLTMQEHRRHSRSALPRGFYPDILGSPSFLGSLSDCSRGPVRLGLQRASPTPRRTFCRRSGLGITPGPSTTCSRYTAPPPINVTRDYRCCQTPSVVSERIWRF